MTKIYFHFLITFSLCAFYGHAQKRTKDHIVEKGETVYRLSKTYNTSISDIVKLNPSASKVIYIGEVLKIPISKVNSGEATTNNKQKTTITDYVSPYTVKSGETKFGLSKKFGMTIINLEKQNPHIIKGLQAGHVLRISTSNTPTNSQITAKNNSKKSGSTQWHEVIKGDTFYSISKLYTVDLNLLIESNSTITADDISIGSQIKIPSQILESNTSLQNRTEYVVKKGDTKYSLAKTFKTTITKLENLNPQIKDILRSGITIKTPIILKTLESPNNANVQQNEGDLNNQIKSNKIQLIDSNMNNIASPRNNTTIKSFRDLSASVDISKNKKILMLMPFNEEEFNSYEKDTTNYGTISITELKEYIQFYKGAKTAVDSLSKIGLPVKINLLKIDDLKIKKMSDNINLDSYDAIITIRYDKTIEKTILSHTDNDIPIISLNSKNEDYKDSSIFQALPSVNTQKLKTLKHVNDKKGNIIVISDYDRIESRVFITNHSPSAKMIVTNKKDEYSDEDILSQLVKNKTNYVIIDSKKRGLFLSSTTLLLGQTSNYDIQLVVLEASMIPKNQEISSKRFRILKLIYPDINQITNTKQTLNYFDSYKLKYKIEPSRKNLQGFDITFDTALRLSQDIAFKDSALEHKTSYFTLKFNYIKNNFLFYDNNEIIIREFKD